MIEILIFSLICWRVTYMLVLEMGPYDIFEGLRLKAEKYRWSPLECFYCTSVWVGFAIMAVFNQPFHYLFVYSAIAVLIQSIVEWLKS